MTVLRPVASVLLNSKSKGRMREEVCVCPHTEKNVGFTNKGITVVCATCMQCACKGK